MNKKAVCFSQWYSFTFLKNFCCFLESLCRGNQRKNYFISLLDFFFWVILPPNAQFNVIYEITLRLKMIEKSLINLHWMYCKSNNIMKIDCLPVSKLKVIFHFLFKEWQCISLEAKDLISHLLVRDATKRYTTDMILEHSWIEEVCVCVHFLLHAF